MAKIVSEQVVIEVSRIAKDSQDLEPQITDEIKSTLEQVAAELFPGAIVEVKDPE